MARPAVTMEVGDDGVAVITMFHPPVNAINNDVMKGVHDSLKEAHSRRDVKAIVLTGADGKFSGGADIGTLQKTKAKDVQADHDPAFAVRGVPLMNDVLEGGPKPVVAAIEGFALGGGLEYAMSCHARLAAPATKLGLPELQLGIIPGLGGTQRLPRLVGVKKALDMMLTGQFISSEAAFKAGLVDAVVPAEKLLTEGRRWSLDISTGRRPWHRSLARTDHLGSLKESLQLIKDARGKVSRTSQNVPHPSACLDAVEEGFLKDPFVATVLEEKLSRDLRTTPTARGLMHAFFSERAVTKVPGATDQGLKARPVRSVAVVGGGLMGSGIATAIVLQQIPVLLKEVNPEALEYGMNLVTANLKRQAAKGVLSAQKLQSTLALIKGTLDYRDFKDADVVIEAVFESPELKQTVFKDLEMYCKPDCILASNTSQIDLSVVGAKTSSQGRIAGTHFFSPAHVMPLLEIVRTEKTSAQVLVDLLHLGKVIKKQSVVVKSSIGFAVNRVFFPYGMSSAFLATELGIHPYRIDSIVKKFGMPMGPFRMNDLAGMKIGQATREQWYKAFPDRVYRSAPGAGINNLLIDQNRLGEKTGQGYYSYAPGSRKEQPAPELDDILVQARKANGLDPNLKEWTLSDEEVLEMVFFPVINEACRVLEERIVLRASDLDLASILGMGFPRYRGGIVFWGDLVGAKYIHSQLSKWTTLHQSRSLGTFFKPCPSLERVVRQDITLAQILEQNQSRL